MAAHLFRQSLFPLCPALSRSHVGYIPFEGRFGVRDSPYHRFREQRASIDLQPVKKVTFSVDPFRRDSGGIRNAMHAFSHDKVSGSYLCLFA